jgi:ABC-type transport system involved in multi-copper enzyme maturation permease subunit
MFGGYQGTLLDAFISIVSKKEGLIIAIPVILAILHIIVFCYMLLRFARGQALSIAPQVYCLAIVIMAVIEKVRLILVSDNAAFFWFGLFSVPHVICLFLIIVLNRNESRKNGAQLTGSANLLREGLTH